MVLQTPTERERWIGTDVTNVASLSGKSWNVPALLFAVCLGSFLDASNVPSSAIFGNLNSLNLSCFFKMEIVTELTQKVIVKMEGHN